MEILEPRLVPLGGLRAMTVRRTLPQRARTTIGAWCFVDHYGPDQVAQTGGMEVPPHPHTGLQTASWLFTGEVEHRDSAGNHAFVRPGELNLMTAGRGISHSERSTPDTSTLHGVQLWIALPDRARFIDPGFEHYVPPEIKSAGWRARVFLGEMFGSRSPVQTQTPLLGAEVHLETGAELSLQVDSSFEHGILVDSGDLIVDGDPVARGELAYLPKGEFSISLEAASKTRLMLLGGPPFGEQLVMWWNFVARSHDEVVDFWHAWQEEALGTVVTEPIFGLPEDDPGDPLPAPALPNARLRPRG
jgi:redox-sensitive bicupin YhaK (pirin superfamily)